MFEMMGKLIDIAIDNPGKTLILIGATVATGGLATMAAPTIAATLGSVGLLGSASTGATIAGLHGAALTNASLAALGGGSLAAGGGGVALGTAVVGSTGAAVAAGVTGVAVSG